MKCKGRTKYKDYLRIPKYRIINEPNWKRLCLLGKENRSLNDFLNQTFPKHKYYVEFVLWMDKVITEDIERKARIKKRLKVTGGFKRHKNIIRAETRKYVNLLKQEGYEFICEVCGDKKPQVHHNSYYIFNDITFLCQKCHIEEHRRLRLIHRNSDLSQKIKKKR